MTKWTAITAVRRTARDSYSSTDHYSHRQRNSGEWKNHQEKIQFYTRQTKKTHYATGERTEFQCKWFIDHRVIIGGFKDKSNSLVRTTRHKSACFRIAKVTSAIKSSRETYKKLIRPFWCRQPKLLQSIFWNKYLLWKNVNFWEFLNFRFEDFKVGWLTAKWKTDL